MLACIIWTAFAAVGTLSLAAPSSQAAYDIKEQHPLPQGWTQDGTVDGGDLLRLQIGLRAKHSSAVEDQLQQTSDPKHQRYCQYISAEELQSLVEPSETALRLVTEWLQDHGLTNATISLARDWIFVRTTVEQAEKLLGTKYTRFRHVDGTSIIRTLEWSLPKRLHEYVDVIQPTTSFFRPKANALRFTQTFESTRESRFSMTANITSSTTLTVSNTCNASHVDLDCLRILYGTYNYTAQVPDKNSIAVANYLDQTNYRADISKFLLKYRPEAATVASSFPITTIDDADDDQGPYTIAQLRGQKNLEGDLDAEMTIGLSWPTTFGTYSTGGSPPYNPNTAEETDGNEPYLELLNYILEQPTVPSVLSTSYGDDEQSVPESYARRVCTAFAQLGARGVSIIFSSGDHGVGGTYNYCYADSDPNSVTFVPTFPPTCPWVTAVGGTSGIQPEVATTQYGSGAGFSNYFDLPWYQFEAVTDYTRSLDGSFEGLYNPSGRAYPDVAAQAQHIAVAWANRTGTVDGTSAAAPIFASVITLVNDALIAAGRPPLGFLNPWLYSSGHKALTDITSGSSFGCNGTGFPVQEGWDAVTGRGSPRLADLIQAALGDDLWVK